VKRRYFVPETIQTSAMDCGPASLRTLLEGYGIKVSYGRLREACQTCVDGTSIDDLEITAVQLGLDAVQLMLPVDHLLVPESKALPALVVVRQPNGATHFVVLWRKHGSWIQVMDPATGRRWVHWHQLEKDLYLHNQTVLFEAWKEFTESDGFKDVLNVRLRQLGAHFERLISDDPRQLMRLDAATRMAASLVRSGVVSRGSETESLLETLAATPDVIPSEYWTATPAPSGDSGSVVFRGCVLLHVAGVHRPIGGEDLSVELVAALAEARSSPEKEFLRIFLSDGALFPAATLGALMLGAATVAEAALLRGFLDLGRELTTAGQRIACLGVLLLFSLILLSLDFFLRSTMLRMGRRVEGRLLIRFLEKLPRLNDRYFQSRPISDMTERCYNAHHLRRLPELAGLLGRNLFEMAFTVAGIAWLYPDAFFGAVAAAAAAVAIPLVAQPMLAERDLRVRTHSGSLMRFYLDALLGLIPIRAHQGDRAMRSEQAVLLAEWARSGFRLQRTIVLAESLQLIFGLVATGWVVWTHLAQRNDIGGLLLLVYWVLNLPALGNEIAMIAWQYPMLRNNALRLMEPLGAPEEASGPEGILETGGVAIDIENVTVRAAGHPILQDLSLSIQPGSHVAIIGPSGAGKSTLVSLLLGWHTPAAGSLMVNGRALDGSLLSALRRHTAWLDPQVLLWNRALYDNLRYGCDDEPAMEKLLECAELTPLLERLPDGLQTMLGENGRLLSGGQGQRVRLGRALARNHIRLAILDEPGRGLDRRGRQRLIERAKEHWRDATLLCTTHDVEETQSFDRVLVISQAQVAEDGCPAVLAARSGSLYRRLIDAERAVRDELWSSGRWRRMHLAGWRLVEIEREGVYETSV
jgi:ABC-type bacteriocin/lantibiotic exporter with double-glycine peptidase domain